MFCSISSYTYFVLKVHLLILNASLPFFSAFRGAVDSADQALHKHRGAWEPNGMPRRWPKIDTVMTSAYKTVKPKKGQKKYTMTDRFLMFPANSRYFKNLSWECRLRRLKTWVCGTASPTFQEHPKIYQDTSRTVPRILDSAPTLQDLGEVRLRRKQKGVVWTISPGKRSHNFAHVNVFGYFWWCFHGFHLYIYIYMCVFFTEGSNAT